MFVSDGLLVSAWGHAWRGWGCQCSTESLPLPESVFLLFPPNLCLWIVRELHPQLFLLDLKWRSGKSIKADVALLWGDFSLPLREVKGPELSKSCWRLHGWSVYLPGRHWKALRMDELMDASRDENESCQSLNDMLYVMAKHPVTAVPQV